MRRLVCAALLLVGCGSRTELRDGPIVDAAQPVPAAASCLGALGEVTVLTPDAQAGCCGIAVDRTHVYFSRKGAGVARIPIEGGAATTLVTTSAQHLIVAGASLFVGRNAGGYAVSTVATTGGAATSIATGDGELTSLSVAADGALWFAVRYGSVSAAGLWSWRPSTGAVRVAAMPGGGVAHRAIATTTGVFVGYALAGGDVSGLARFDVAAGQLTNFKTEAYYPSGFATIDGQLYASMAQRLVRYDAVGDTATPTTLATIVQTADVAVDETHVTFADAGNYYDDLPPPKPADTPGRIRRVARSGGDAETLVTEGRGVGRLTVDACHVYYTSARGLLRLRKNAP